MYPSLQIHITNHINPFILLITFISEYIANVVWELVTRKCRLDYQIQITNYSIVWHLPPLADPGPCRLAIQLALLSSFNCLSSLPATSLRRAASLAWGEITPTREIRHWACALAMQVLSNLLYWLTMTLNCPSSSGLPVERQRCSTLLSAQIWTKLWRSLLQSPQAPATKHSRSPKPWSLATSAPVSPGAVPRTCWSNLSKGRR